MRVRKEQTFNANMVDSVSDESVAKFAKKAWLDCFEDAYVRGMIDESDEMEDGVVTSYTLKFNGFFFTKHQIVDLIKLARRCMAPSEVNKLYNILQIKKSDVNET